MLVGIILIPVLNSLSVPALAYLVSSAVGIAGVASRALRFGETQRRASAEVGTRSFVAGLSVLLTQGDRVFVGLLGSISGLAAYDLASRFVTSVKLIVILLSTGMVAEGSRAAAGHMSRAAAERRRHHLQRVVDATTLAIFVCCPLLVAGVALIAQPSLAAKTAVIAAILAVGHGLHASTAPTTAFLSGMRFPVAEVRYQLIAVAVLIVTAPILGATLGATGIALSVALALGSGSLWLRAHAPGWVAARLLRAEDERPPDLLKEPPAAVAQLREVEL
jgi:O-antigen/teichoic acid export membrane protein